MSRIPRHFDLSCCGLAKVVFCPTAIQVPHIVTYVIDITLLPQSVGQAMAPNIDEFSGTLYIQTVKTESGERANFFSYCCYCNLS